MSRDLNLQILVTEPDDYSEQALELYRRIGVPVLGLDAAYDPEQVKILVVRLGHQINKQLLCRFPRLEVLASPTTGLTHLDQDVCNERGIRIISLQGATDFLDTITATAEHTLALMLALIRRIPAAQIHTVEEGKWERDHFRSHMMKGLTLGIIGCGRVGRQLARLGHALQMRVLAFDLKPESIPPDIETARTIRQVAESADILSLHASAGNPPRCILDRDIIAHIKTGAYVINTSRGELVDEDALADALSSGKLRGVAVDVISDELRSGRLSSHSLRMLAKQGANVIMTPHIAGCCKDAMQATEAWIAEAVVKDWQRYRERTNT